MDVIEYREDVCALGESAFSLSAGESGRDFIAPAALPHELVPYLDVVLSRPAPDRKAPGEDLFVGPTLPHALDEHVIRDAQKCGAIRVEAFA